MYVPVGCFYVTRLCFFSAPQIHAADALRGQREHLTGEINVFRWLIFFCKVFQPPVGFHIFVCEMTAPMGIGGSGGSKSGASAAVLEPSGIPYGVFSTAGAEGLEADCRGRP